MAQEEPVDAAGAERDGKKRKRVDVGDVDDAGAANNKARVNAPVPESNILFASRFHLQRTASLRADQVAAITARMMLVPQLQKMPVVLIPIIESYFGAPTVFGYTSCITPGCRDRTIATCRVDRFTSPTSFEAHSVGLAAASDSRDALRKFAWSDFHAEWFLVGSALPERHQPSWGIEYEIDLFNHFRVLQRPIRMRLACGHVVSAQAPMRLIERMMRRDECWKVSGVYPLWLVSSPGGRDHTSVVALRRAGSVNVECAECATPMIWQARTCDILAGLICNLIVEHAPGVF